MQCWLYSSIFTVASVFFSKQITGSETFLYLIYRLNMNKGYIKIETWSSEMKLTDSSSVCSFVFWDLRRSTVATDNALSCSVRGVQTDDRLVEASWTTTQDQQIAELCTNFVSTCYKGTKTISPTCRFVHLNTISISLGSVQPQWLLFVHRCRSTMSMDNDSCIQLSELQWHGRN